MLIARWSNLYIAILLGLTPRFVPGHSANVTVEMRNNSFLARNVTISVGDTVTWIQKGSNHDTVSNTGVWKSEILEFNETFSFTFTMAGTYNYFCTPHRNAGMTGTVTVQAVNTPPVVVLDAPTANATFRAGESITFSATATDAGGSVTKVEFFANETLVGTASSSPYSVSATLAPGSYAVTAKATDNANSSTTTTPLAVRVAAIPSIDSIERSEGGVEIVVSGTTDIPHTLEGAEELNNFTEVDTRTPENGTVTFIDSAQRPKRFYRVAVKQQL